MTNGYKFLAVTDSQTYQKILGLYFNQSQVVVQKDTPTPFIINDETLDYEIPNELLEKFYREVQNRFDPALTQIKFARAGLNSIDIKIKNTKAFERKDQLRKIENAAKACCFAGLVMIYVEKTLPKHSQDKAWFSTLACHGPKIMVTNQDDMMFGGLVLVAVIVFIVIVFFVVVAMSQ